MSAWCFSWHWAVADLPRSRLLAGDAPVVKIAVPADGIYEVPASDLRAAGFDLAKADTRALSLTSGGKAISFEVIGDGNQRVLRFYGQALEPEARTAQNIYWLSKQPDGAGQAASAIVARSAAPSSGMNPATVVSATVHAEEQHQWVAKAGPGDDRWVWQTIFAPTEAKFNISAPISHQRRGRATRAGLGQLIRAGEPRPPLAAVAEWYASG